MSRVLKKGARAQAKSQNGVFTVTIPTGIAKNYYMGYSGQIVATAYEKDATLICSALQADLISESAELAPNWGLEFEYGRRILSVTMVLKTKTP